MVGAGVEPRIAAPVAVDWEVLRTPADWNDPALRAGWDRLTIAGGSLRAVFQCPAYFDHLLATTPGARVAVAVARGRDGPLAVVPLVAERVDYRILVQGSRFFRVPLAAVTVPGGEAALPADPALYDGFLQATAAAFPDCAGIELNRVPVGDPLLDYLTAGKPVASRFLVSVPPFDHVAHHTLRLPPTFADYLAKLARKRRYNLGRQVRIFSARCGGADPHRMKGVRELEPFFDAVTGSAAGYVTRGPVLSCPAEQSRLRDLAGRGLVLGYSLGHGNTVVAWMLGYYYGGTYLVVSIGYHPAYARYSPGAVLLHRVVEDLIATRSASVINFGDGRPAYRYHAVQELVHYAGVMLLHDRPAARALMAVDSAVQTAKKPLKWILRTVGVGLEEDDPLRPLS